MARLSASWATRRYFWAIGEPDGQQQPNLRLSDDARRMDFHQKTLLSDEFGIGMAGLLMENFFAAGSFVDISIALNDPAAYQDIERRTARLPDVGRRSWFTVLRRRVQRHPEQPERES